MRLFISAFIVLLSTSALAAPNPRVDAYLASTEATPADRAELERAIPDAHATLMAAAQEEGRAVWQRLRAIAFLSFYPDDATYAVLDRLIGSTTSDVRRAAVYSLGRTFKSRPGVSARIAKVAETDPVIDVAEHAVRALRWVDEPGAGERLATIGTKRPELKKLVSDTAARRVR